MEMTKTALSIAAGVAGTLFLGYCIYFDKKRRSDPDFKKKLRARRKQNRKNGATKNPLPSLNDHEAIERYFLQEIQMGETLISRGDFEGGVEHLANALVVCGQPARLLQVLQTTLPAQVFSMLIMKMQEFGNKANEQSNSNNKSSTGNKLAQDFVAMGLENSSEAVSIDDLD